MSVTFSIILVVLFFLVSELIMLAVKNEGKFGKAYAFIIRILICMLVVGTIYELGSSDNKHISYLEESNNFKREVIYIQDSLITAQRKVLDNAIGHCELNHDCDAPFLDGDDAYNMNTYKDKLDSIYNTQE